MKNPVEQLSKRQIALVKWVNDEQLDYRHLAPPVGTFCAESP
ncbi:hypothetical protein SPBRAN_95 [uncultured Candidatus Thioglobus sp.]|nr:hypothetical protein SPBRAN_95 [uncultured Candidatus Thioglobus sp.]